ncbi:MAG: FeoB-associated Cys-rich membrane protein [Erysipelotrichaceae bacterium]|nr:FeoB-associated Cys-rich membrane protein [Erysipelotrichaceae bacterium]MDD3809765.1 FeoB-associated Cys-rich membrane protein [Erysipelotrichaceae bacterium]
MENYIILAVIITVIGTVTFKIINDKRHNRSCISCCGCSSKNKSSKI